MAVTSSGHKMVLHCCGTGTIRETIFLIRIPQLYTPLSAPTHTHPGVTCPTSQSRTHIQRSKEKNDNYKNNYFSPSGILLSRESNYLYLKFMGVSWFRYYHLLENSLRYQILVLFNGTFLRKKRLIGDRLKGGDTFLSAYQITWTEPLLQDFFHV